MKRFFILLAILIPPVINAQEAVLSCGGTASGGGATSEYSVGQVCYNMGSVAGYTITEGIQQPLEILIPIGIEEYPAFLHDAYVYPNPADDIIFLKIDNQDLSGLGFSVCDTKGNALINGEITSGNTLIPVKELPSGFYIIRISAENQTLRNFKIIKR